MPSNLTILSYNLKRHRAIDDVAEIVNELRAGAPVNVVCLQECYAAQLPRSIGGLTLAGASTVGKDHLAIYYDRRRFRKPTIIRQPLQLSHWEHLRRRDRNRLLIAQLTERTSENYIVASFHATHLVATNALRRQQITTAVEACRTRNDDRPAVIIGDFNYPFFRSGLAKAAEKCGAILHTSNSPTLQNKIMRGFFDYALTVNFRSTGTFTLEALPQRASDHMPILARVRLGTRPRRHPTETQHP